MGRDDFLVSPSNEEAVAWIDKWPGWPGPMFVLVGPAASGKTHLARVWQQRADALWGTEETLNAVMAQLEAGGAVCLDVNGRVDDETWLFHAFNWAREHGGTILLTGRDAPKSWPVTLKDLRSRLLASPTATLLPPDDPLLAAIIVKLFDDRQLELTAPVLDYVLPRMERSFEAARSLVSRLDRMSLSRKKPVTVPLVREALESRSGL